MFATGFILFINGMEKPHYKTPMGKSQRNQGWITLPGSDIILPPLYRAVTTAHTSDTPPKKHLFGFDYHVYFPEMMRFKAKSV